MNSSNSDKNTSKGIQITEHQFRDLLTAFVESHKSQRAAAADLGLSPGQLNDVLIGRKPISDTIAARMGYRRVLMFESNFDF